MVRPVRLAGPQAHQMRRVLRLTAGDRVTLLDNTGLAYEAAIVEYGREDVRLDILASRQAGGEPRVRLTLCQAALKGERFEWLLQKGTEIGVCRFVPLICVRNVVEDRRALASKKLRWQRIIQEAAEQSGRGRLPELSLPQELAEALADGDRAGRVRLMPWEEEKTLGLRAALDKCNLISGTCIEVFIGPEGGLTAAEVALAAEHGVQPVTLGPRILRAETAGLAVATAVLYHAGEMDPRA